MNRKLALLCAGALLLTGCEPEKDHYGPDFREAAYGDFLRYTLGEDYRITLNNNKQGPDGEYYSEWTARYTPDGADAPRDLHYITYEFHSGMPSIKTEQNFSEYLLLHALVPAAEQDAMQEFADKILSKYYHVNSFENTIKIRMEQGVTVSCWLYYLPTDAKVPCPALTARAVSPQTGLSVRNANLQSAAQDENFILCFETEITSDAADAQRFTEQAARICEDYLRETGTPKNYRFCVTRTGYADGKETEEILFDRTQLEGIGEYDAASQTDAHNIWWDLMDAETAYLNQKYEG